MMTRLHEVVVDHQGSVLGAVFHRLEEGGIVKSIIVENFLFPQLDVFWLQVTNGEQSFNGWDQRFKEGDIPSLAKLDQVLHFIEPVRSLELKLLYQDLFTQKTGSRKRTIKMVLRMLQTMELEERCRIVCLN